MNYRKSEVAEATCEMPAYIVMNEDSCQLEDLHKGQIKNLVSMFLNDRFFLSHIESLTDNKLSLYIDIIEKHVDIYTLRASRNGCFEVKLMLLSRVTKLLTVRKYLMNAIVDRD